MYFLSFSAAYGLTSGHQVEKWLPITERHVRLVTAWSERGRGRIMSRLWKGRPRAQYEKLQHKFKLSPSLEAFSGRQFFCLIHFGVITSHILSRRGWWLASCLQRVITHSSYRFSIIMSRKLSRKLRQWSREGQHLPYVDEVSSWHFNEQIGHTAILCPNS